MKTQQPAQPSTVRKAPAVPVKATAAAPDPDAYRNEVIRLVSEARVAYDSLERARRDLDFGQGSHEDVTAAQAQLTAALSKLNRLKSEGQADADAWRKAGFDVGAFWEAQSAAIPAPTLAGGKLVGPETAEVVGTIMAQFDRRAPRAMLGPDELKLGATFDRLDADADGKLSNAELESAVATIDGHTAGRFTEQVLSLKRTLQAGESGTEAGLLGLIGGLGTGVGAIVALALGFPTVAIGAAAVAGVGAVGGLGYMMLKAVQRDNAGEALDEAILDHLGTAG